MSERKYYLEFKFIDGTTMSFDNLYENEPPGNEDWYTIESRRGMWWIMTDDGSYGFPLSSIKYVKRILKT